MKKIKYLFFISIFFINISNVFAEETLTGLGYLNNSSVIISDNRGNDIQLARNTTNSLNINIRNIIFQSNYNIQKNVVYEYEVNLANEYINTSVNSFFIRGGDTICNFMSLKGLNSSYLKIRFTCPSNISYFTIGLSNLAESNITDSYGIRWNNIYLWQVNDTIDLGPVINNQTENTQDIINNQNQNTQDIIDNQNELSEQQHQQQLVCEDITINNTNIGTDNSYYFNGTEYGDAPPTLITSFYELTVDSTLQIIGTTNYYTQLCFFNSSKVKTDCITYNTLSNGDFINIPNNAKYFRATIYKQSNSPNFILKYCENGNQVLNDKLDEQNETSKGILGKLKDLISYINPFSENFFVYKLIDLLEDLLKSLFIPSSEFLSNWFNDLKTWIENKFGILSAPFTIFINFVQLYLTLEDQEIIINIPQIVVPNFEDTVLVQAQSFNWGELLRSKPAFLNMWNIYLDFIDVFIILNFLGLCETTYNRIFGGDTSQYEYYTTEETYNINDETGEATNHMLRQRRTRREKV